MKPEIHIFLIMALLMLTGCGQKGDLYQTEDAPPPTMEQSDS
jgi:predicted small lipoprotein YifL